MQELFGGGTHINNASAEGFWGLESGEILNKI
jgi:hypothetical protein